MKQRDCKDLLSSLYKLDPHWDEFPAFIRTETQNLDGIEFTKGGKPMTGYFRSNGVLAHHLVQGRWFETKQRA